MNRNPVLLVAAATLSWVHTSAALSTDRIPVSELKPLLKLAIDRGEAYGVLTGESAAYIKQKFGTTAALEIDVRTLYPLTQPGCSRLQVITRQNGVQEKVSREDKSLTYQINYCRDGGFPNKK
jgi:hypothetical protein